MGGGVAGDVAGGGGGGCGVIQPLCILAMFTSCLSTLAAGLDGVLGADDLLVSHDWLIVPGRGRGG